MIRNRSVVPFLFFLFDFFRFISLFVILTFFSFTMVNCGGGGGGGSSSSGSSGSNNVSTTVIGTNGGSITSTDGKAKVKIPAGALTSDTTISIAIIEDNNGQVGSMYQVSAQGSEDLVFLSPVTITVNYDPNLLPSGANEGSLQLGLLGPFDSWEILTNSIVDTVKHTLTATASHFSNVGVLPIADIVTAPKFGFPLPNRTPFNATITSVFDHSMDPKKPYNADNIVKAYTGEIGDFNKIGCFSLKGLVLCEYSNSSMTDFNIFNNNYIGADGGKKYLSYDGHPGYDYRTKDVDQDPINGQIDVLAAAGGTVHIPLQSKYGTIWIDHGNGYSTWYLHLSDRSAVYEGKTVTKGEKVGVSGNTAPFYVGAHLHFELKKNNVPIDPYAENLWEAQPMGYAISGTVTSGGVGLSGVMVVLTGTGSTSTTTDSNGNYTFTGAANGSYTITPSKTGCIFTPSNRSISVNNANVTGQDFVATAITSGVLVFSSYRDGNWEVYKMDIDGSNQTNLTNNPALDADPAFSPDGNKIIFASNRECSYPGLYKLYTMNSDGTNLTRLPAGFSIAPDGSPFCEPFILNTPKFSPDGSKIVFRGNVVPGGPSPGNTQIYIMNSDGTNLINLSNNSYYEKDPVFTPDGQKIVFASNRNGNYEIYIMNINGTNQIRLTNAPGDDDVPEISPDGSKISFTSSRDGNYEVYIMNIDGSNQINLSNNPADDGDSTFSSDGSQIAFISGRNGNYEVYIMNSNGTNQIRLTNTSAMELQPFFKP